MQKEGVLSLIHGDIVQIDVYIFDREKVFIETVVAPLI